MVQGVFMQCSPYIGSWKIFVSWHKLRRFFSCVCGWGTAENHTELRRQCRERVEPQEHCVCTKNIESFVWNELVHCHDAAAKFLLPKVPVSCAVQRHELTNDFEVIFFVNVLAFCWYLWCTTPWESKKTASINLTFLRTYVGGPKKIRLFNKRLIYLKNYKNYIIHFQNTHHWMICTYPISVSTVQNISGAPQLGCCSVLLWKLRLRPPKCQIAAL